ncbi:MAG TPA: hypothetical protein VN679_07430, partial [Candidatus Acidoferrales bacterium]|nr:hypothetical protein [Candidatus Acidoferrales bacterium]
LLVREKQANRRSGVVSCRESGGVHGSLPLLREDRFFVTYPVLLARNSRNDGHGWCELVGPGKRKL